MPDDLPSLHALHAFDAAARAGSFTAAARALHRTHGAVSRQVRALEDELGTRLFVRGARRVSLTADGEALLAATGRAFAALRDGVSDLKRRRGGPFVLSCEPTLALAWLIPRLRDLERRAPDVVVHVESRGGAIALAGGGVDLAVRRRDFPIGEGVRVEALMDEWLGPVCSPAVARALARGARATLLHTRTRPDGFADWTRATARAFPLPRARDAWFEHFAWSLEAAVAGLGVALGPYPLVMDAMRAGRLVAPFGFVRGEVGYVLLSRPDARADPREAAIRSWLSTHAAKAAPPRALRRAAPHSSN